MRRPKSAFLCLLFVACQQAGPTPTLLPTETPAGLTPRPAVKTPTPAPEASSTRPPTLTAPPATPTAEPPKPWGPTTDCPAQTSQAFEFDQPDSIDDLVAQILAYLNLRGSSIGLQEMLSQLRWDLTEFPAYLDARLEVQELTGEGRPEVVVGVTMPISFSDSYHFDTAAMLTFACQDYEFRLADQSVVGTSFRNLEIEGIVDMDGNDLPEVIYSYLPGTGARGYGTLYVHVVEWDGSQFVSRLSPVAWSYPYGLLVGDLAGYFSLQFQPGETAGVEWADGVARGEEVRVLDIDGDGKLELLLRNGYLAQYFHEGAKRVRTEILKWKDGLLEFAYWEHTPAEFRFQAVEDGDDAARFGFYDRALALYQDAIYDPDLRGWSQGQFWPDSFYSGIGTPQAIPTPDPNERPRLEAYARYRIMLLHAAQGYPDATQTVYQALLARFPAGTPGYPYTQLATAFYENFAQTGDLAAACELATAFAASHEQEIVTPLSSDFYGVQGAFLWVDDVCPFGE